MKNIIELWEEELLPIKDAIYLSSGKSFLCKITSHPERCIEKNGEFDFCNFYEENKDELTSIDIFKEIKLINDGYCCIGEGSYGSEGFIAYLDRNKKLVWVLYSEESNPFIDASEIKSGVIIAKSSSNIVLEIDINNPVNLKLIH